MDLLDPVGCGRDWYTLLPPVPKLLPMVMCPPGPPAWRLWFRSFSSRRHLARRLENQTWRNNYVESIAYKCRRRGTEGLRISPFSNLLSTPSPHVVSPSYLDSGLREINFGSQTFTGKDIRIVSALKLCGNSYGMVETLGTHSSLFLLFITPGELWWYLSLHIMANTFLPIFVHIPYQAKKTHLNGKLWLQS